MKQVRTSANRAMWCLLICLVAPVTVTASVSVKDFGAVGDGKTDDSWAFQKALEAAKGQLLIPAGRYRIADVVIPDGTMVQGVGVRSVIVMLADAGAAFRLGSDCTMTDLKFTGNKADKGPATGAGTAGVVHAPRSVPYSIKRIKLKRLTFENIKRCAIFFDHVRDFNISDCRFVNIGVAISLHFSRNGRITAHQIENAVDHGILFWGDWKHDPLEKVTNLIFTNNYVKNGGGGAIWGMGGKQIVMVGNIIEGADDIGLDLEWCDNSVIVGNTTVDCDNAGIALFAACKNVTIAGNTVVITDPMKKAKTDADASRAARYDGIWLAPPSPRYAFDKGHRLVTITGNSIRAEGDQSRHGIFIGNGSEDIVCHGNVMQNADILDRTGELGPDAADELARTMTVVKLNQRWQFKPDPGDQGVQERWFAPDLDDSDWITVRSDKGTGWEGQAFEGYYVGYGWCRAELPKLPRRSQAFKYLYFGAVDEQAWIYLNGQRIGEHTEKSTGKSLNDLWTEPFCVDVTKHLRTNGPNILAIRVHNSGSMGGIWKPVYLVFSDTAATLSHQQDAIRLSKWDPLSIKSR